MKKLPLLALLFAATLATAADLPEEVIVGTDSIPAAKFASWKPSNATSFSASYEGEVGGDSSGKITIKVTKTGDESVPYYVSGTYKYATASMEVSVITFTNLTFDGEDEKYRTASAGPISVTFVSYEGQKGLVIGGTFIPKA